MTRTALKSDPLVCPLYSDSNACVNLSADDTSYSCWCNDPSIQFPEELLLKVPMEARRLACICKACVLKYQEGKEAR